MVWSPTLHSKELLNDVTQFVQWTIKQLQEKMHKKIEKKKKKFNNGISAILWQTGGNAATVE